jgi:hypothetical protein
VERPFVCHAGPFATPHCDFLGFTLIVFQNPLFLRELFLIFLCSLLLAECLRIDPLFSQLAKEGAARPPNEVIRALPCRASR